MCQTNVKKELLQTSRGFFDKALEASVVRPLAARIDCIPTGVDIFTLSDDVDKDWNHQTQEYEFAKEAFFLLGQVKTVKGTQLPFPANGPSCKYTALFDPHHAYDAIRVDFLLRLDKNSAR